MNTRALPVFPLAPDPIRPEVARDAQAVRVDVDPIGPLDGPQIGLVTLGLVARNFGFRAAWMIAAVFILVAAPGYLVRGRFTKETPPAT